MILRKTNKDLVKVLQTWINMNQLNQIRVIIQLCGGSLCNQLDLFAISPNDKERRSGFTYSLWWCFSSWNCVHHQEGYTRGGCRRVTLWFGLATNIRTLKQTHHNQAEILGHLIPNLLVWWLYLICWIKSTMMNSSSKAYRLFGCASIAIKQKQMVCMYAWKHWDVVFVLFFYLLNLSSASAPSM